MARSLVAQLTTTFSRQRRALRTAPESPIPAFLEPESDEYRRVVLPPRERKAYTPPWPTLLAPSTRDDTQRSPAAPRQAPVTYLAQSNATAKQRPPPPPCAAIHQLIRVEKDLPAARALLSEFHHLGIPVHSHRAFLDAALHRARRRGAHVEIKADILAWLRLYHAFPPTRQFRHAHIGALEPLVELVLERWSTDLPFLRDLLLLASERGWIPALVPVLFKHYTMCAGPEASFMLLNELAGAYASKTPPVGTRWRDNHATATWPPSEDTAKEEAAEDTQRRAKHVIAQVTKWRNLHLRTVLQSDRHLDEAKMIYEAGEHAGVVWDRATKLALVHALQSRVVAQVAVPPSEGQPNDDDDISLTRHIIRVAHARSRQPVRRLVDVLQLLEAHGRGTLFSRLEKRFLRGPPSAFRRRRPTTTTTTTTTADNANTTTAGFWWMANIIVARLQGRHEDAWRIFQKRFYAVGLAAVEGVKLPSSTSDRLEATTYRKKPRRTPTTRVWSRKLYPTPEIISAVLPSLIHLANPTTLQSLAALHANILLSPTATTGIGSLMTPRTDPVLHLPFILFSARNFGARETEKWCTRLEERHGVCVGVQGWSVVAVEYAKGRKMADIDGILNRMTRRQRPWQEEGEEERTTPSPHLLLDSAPHPPIGDTRPNERTFMGIAAALLKRKKYYKAKAVLERWHHEEQQWKEEGVVALVGGGGGGDGGGVAGAGVRET